MALASPLSRADFLLRFPIVECIMPVPGPGLNVNRTAGGTLVRGEVSPALWEATYTVAATKSPRIDDLHMRLAWLQVPGRVFRMFNPLRVGPASDPSGSLFEGPTFPEISGFSLTNSALELINMPPDFSLKAGDLLSFQYLIGGGTSYMALHAITEDRATDGSGTVANLEVVPHLRPGLTIGTEVEFQRPQCYGMIVPGSVQAGSHLGAHASGFSFRAIQSLRR